MPLFYFVYKLINISFVKNKFMCTFASFFETMKLLNKMLTLAKY